MLIPLTAAHVCWFGKLKPRTFGCQSESAVTHEIIDDAEQICIVPLSDNVFVVSTIIIASDAILQQFYHLL